MHFSMIEERILVQLGHYRVVSGKHSIDESDRPTTITVPQITGRELFIITGIHVPQRKDRQTPSTMILYGQLLDIIGKGSIHSPPFFVRIDPSYHIVNGELARNDRRYIGTNNPRLSKNTKTFLKGLAMRVFS